MIDRRSSGVATLHAFAVAAEAAAWWLLLAELFQVLPSVTFTTLLPRASYPVAIASAVVVTMGVLWRLEGNFTALGWTEAMRLAFRQIVPVTSAILFVAVAFKDPGISRFFLSIYLASTGLLLVALNRFQPGWLVKLLFRGGARLPTLILGDAALFPDLKQWLAVREKFGLLPVGVLRYRGAAPNISGLEIVGEFTELKAAIAATGARQVLTLNLPTTAEDAEHLARICASCGCRLLIHNNLTFRLSYPLRVLTQDGYSFLAFQDEPLEDPINRCLKRALDVAIALPVVVLVLPVLAAGIWLAQRWQSPGPLFYFQTRSGRGGRTFRIVKFRTMHVPEGVGERRSTAADRRIFPFGAFLRRSSIDEMPQFFNVLVGDMSVVGPRPHFVNDDDLFADAINEYRVRFFVKPGITGLAQSRGLRGEVLTPEAIHRRLQLDLLYIHSWSVWLDLVIIARTMRQVFAPPPGAR